MTAIRKAAVAGTFYPKDAAALRAEVQGYLSAAGLSSGSVPKEIGRAHV